MRKEGRENKWILAKKERKRYKVKKRNKKDGQGYEKEREVD